MEKEKQIFEEWREDTENTQYEDRFSEIIGEPFDEIAFGFYGGYHSRDDEIAALKAEIDSLRQDEKDRAEGNKDYAHFRRRQRLKKCQNRLIRKKRKYDQLRAEVEQCLQREKELKEINEKLVAITTAQNNQIERKDEVIEKALDYIYDRAYGRAIQALKDGE